MRIPTTTRCRRYRGAVLVKVLICLGVIVGVLALNLDGGRMMDERRRAQTAADAAALAAGADLYSNYWSFLGKDRNGTARAAAVANAQANGYPASAVTVNIPPASGSFAGQAGYVEVVIDTSMPVGFGRIFTGNDPKVSARSVSRGAPVDIGILLLRPNGPSAFDNSAAAFALVNKPLIVNSEDPLAFNSRGLVMLNLNRIDVTGGVLNTSLLPIGIRPRTGIRPTLDPLSRLPIPNSATATLRSVTPTKINSILPTVLNPGIYRGGIEISGLSTVVMTPGVYIMEGGGFSVSGLASVVGLETMVYNAAGSTYPAGPIQVNSLGRIAMTAPLSGTYQGLNFFQQRNLTQPVAVTGNGQTVITGTVYAAKAPVQLEGTVAAALDILGGAYVADSMTVRGVGSVTVNLNLNPPRVPDIRTVE